MKINHYKLPNGLNIILANVPGTKTLAVEVLVHTGSRLETPQEAGLAHFLEHMLFKGTKTWPTAEALTQLIDSLGADYNAFTSKEITGFYIKAASEHAPTMMQALSEMIWQSNLDANEMTREKEVVVQEINMYEDNPLMYIEDVLEGELFKGHNLGKLISGTRQSVRALEHKQVNNFLNKFYHPANMVVTVAGEINKNTKSLVSKFFNVKRPRGLTPSFSGRVSIPTKPRLALKFKDTEQVQLALGLPALPLRHKQNAALDVMSIILGGNMSSRLFVRLREKEGLCYSIRAGNMSYEGAGVFTVQAGLDKNQIPKAVKSIKEELERMVREPVSSAELNKAKQFVRGKFILGLEDSAAVAGFLGKRYLLEHKLQAPEKFLEEINKVTIADISAVARAVIRPKCYTLGIIGPFKKEGELRDLLKK